MNYPRVTARQAILKIAIVIAVTELFIMFGLDAYPILYPDGLEAILDFALLVTVSSPIIYYWIIAPFIREREVAIRELADMAYTDPLTGLPNRRAFLKYMEKTLAECARHHIHVALIIIDLDDFTNINESYGQDAGDAVLVNISQRLTKGVRKEDVVSRGERDQFIILIKQLNDISNKAAEEAIVFAEKIKKSLSMPIKYKKNTIRIDSSLGINLLSSDTFKIEEEIRKANVAMYHAKRMGKGQVVMYEPSMVRSERIRE